MPKLYRVTSGYTTAEGRQVKKGEVLPSDKLGDRVEHLLYAGNIVEVVEEQEGSKPKAKPAAAKKSAAKKSAAPKASVPASPAPTAATAERSGPPSVEPREATALLDGSPDPPVGRP